MKKWKRWLCLLLALTMVLPWFPIKARAATVASGQCGDNLTWTLDDGGTLTISGTGDMTDYRYTTKAPWYPHCTEIRTVAIDPGVTSIGNHAFQYCDSLTSITIPDSVTSLGADCFEDCDSLTSITIPDSITSLGKYCFYVCDSLTSITLPDSVTSLGEGCFSYCTSLKHIWVNENNPNYSSMDGILFNKNRTKIVAYPGGRNGHYTVLQGVTTLGDSCFQGCVNLTSITIPDSVTSLGIYCFSDCDSLTSITIPDSVTSLERLCFSDCDSLTSITIPDSVTSLEAYCFDGCTSLTSITIPDSVTSLGIYCFSDCDSLTSITIPDSVTSLGSDCFSYCTSLKHIWVNENNPNYSSMDGILFNKNRTEIVAYPGGRNGHYTVLQGVTTLESGCFRGCVNLTSITIPDSVTSLRNACFAGCTSLTSITIPDSVTSLGSYCFSDCDSLTDVYYGGTEEQWNAITVGSGNEVLETATIHYNSQMPGDGADDKDGFQKELYHADYLMDENVAENLDFYTGRVNHLSPTQMILDINNLESANKLWADVTTVLGTIFDGDAAVKYVFQQEDIYETILLNALNNATTSDSYELSLMQETSDCAQTLFDRIRSTLQAKYSWEVMTSDVFADMNETDKKRFIEAFNQVLQEDDALGALDALGKSATFLTDIMDFATTVEDALQKIVMYAQLWHITDSMAVVLDEMYVQVPTGSDYDAMRSAIRFCSDMIQETSKSQFLSGAMLRNGLMISGRYAMEKSIGKLWNKITDFAIAKNPELSILLASYKLSRSLVNVAMNVDHISEETFKLSAVGRYYDALNATIDTFVENYDSVRTVSNADALLNSLALLFSLFYVDCDTVYSYADVVDDALAYKIGNFLKEQTGADNVKKYATETKANSEIYARRAQTLWVHQLKTDYPHIYPQYAPLIGEKVDKPLIVPITNEVSIECPVDVYVYDSTGTCVASFRDGKVTATDAVTATLDGDHKLVEFYDDQEYRIECIGYDSGTMDISVREYENGEVSREVDYHDLPVENGKSYELTGDSGAITTDNETVPADYDSVNTETVEPVHLEIKNGYFVTDEGPAFAMEAYPGQRVEIAAIVPDGYQFLNWAVDSGDVILQDGSAVQTHIQVPSNNVALTACMELISCAHEFGKWEVTKAATCTESGVEIRTCALCGAEEQQALPALGHDYRSVETAPTCNDNGYTTHTCSRCSDTFTDSETPALGHDYIATVVVHPSCTSDGYTSYVCSRCNDSYKGSHQEALGHNFVEGKCTRCGSVQDNPFSDVPNGQWYTEPVLWAVEKGVTNGMGDGTFGVNLPCNRAQVVTFLWRAAGCPEPSSTECPFTDVDVNQWYGKPVLWAVENGITNGVSATEFGINMACNRATVVTFLWRAEGKPEPASADSPFSDVDMSQWYGKPVLWAVEKGITNGMGDGTFGINGICNRAQVVTFLYRAMA